MTTSSFVRDLLVELKAKNPMEPEFHQAVQEVVESLDLVLERRPEYRSACVIERMVEPERVVMFRVPWEDDRGQVHINRGFRIEMNSAIGPYKGGSLIRPEATGYGAVYFAAEMLATRNETLEGKVCLVSGSGNVAQYTVEKLIELGAKAVTLSDSDGYIYDEAGIDAGKLAFVMDLKNVRRGRIREYADKYRGVVYTPHDARLDANPLWDHPSQCAFPSATQNEISA